LLTFAALLASTTASAVAGEEKREAMGRTPRVVIDRSPNPKRIHLGSPSLAVLPDGSYVASHDFFGPGTDWQTTAVFRSTERGRTWKKAATLKGQFRSQLFVWREGPARGRPEPAYTAAISRPWILKRGIVASSSTMT
jgi:hypothetical protein